MADPIDIDTLPFLVICGSDHEWIVNDYANGENETRPPGDLYSDGTEFTVDSDYTDRGLNVPEVVPSAPPA